MEVHHSKLHSAYCMVEVHHMMLHCKGSKSIIVLYIVHVERESHQDAKCKVDGRSAQNHGTLCILDMLYTKVHGL